MENPAKLPTSELIKSGFQSLPYLFKAGVAPKNLSELKKFLSLARSYKFSLTTLALWSAYRFPDRTALVDDLGELTYSDLEHQGKQIAKALLDLGIGEGSAFGCLARNSRTIPLMGIAKSLTGAEIMLLNPGSSQAQIEQIVETSTMKMIITDSEFVDQIPQLDNLIVVIADESDRSREELPESYLYLSDLVAKGGQSAFKKRPEQGRIVIMSSGTTGLPKGVLRPDPKTPATFGAVVERVPWHPGIVIHQNASMFHAWGFANLFVTFAVGGTVVTMRNFDAEKMVNQCIKYQPRGVSTSAFFIREFMEVLHKNPELDKQVGDLDFIVLAGNLTPTPLVREMQKRFGPVVHNFYGSTEAGVTTIATGEEMMRYPATAGKPTMGAIVKIFDNEGKELPAGEIGKIYTVHEITCTGYLADDHKIVTHNGLFEIGDTGYLNEEGLLFVCGRTDNMVIKGGENVHPAETSDLLAGVKGIAQVYTKGINDDDAVIANLYTYVVRDNSPEGTALTEESIQQIVRDNLAKHNIPDRVIFMDDLPRNATGKVIPGKLPDPKSAADSNED